MGGFSAALALARDAVQALFSPPGSAVVAWFLAGVFLIGGVAKLRRPELAAVAIVDFGVTRRPRPALGRALAAAELVTAALLVAAGRLGAVVAATLLWLFVLLIARSLRRRERFACHCFGTGDAPLSARTLARTGTLALLASGLAVTADAGDASTAGERAVAATVAAALLGSLVLGGRVADLHRRNQVLVRTLRELPA